MQRVLSIIGLGIILTTSSFASETPHERRLAELQARLEVKLAGLTFAQKIQGVRHLHELVFDPGFNQYFGTENVVRTVILYDPIESADGASLNARRADLRDHTVLFDHDGTDAQALRDALPGFQGELEAIDKAESALKLRFSGLKLSRSVNLFYDTVSTNQSYLQNLNALLEATAGSRVATQIQEFPAFWVSDTIDDYEKTALKRGKAYVLDTKTGRMVLIDTLELTIGRENLPWEDNLVDATFLTQLLDLILTKGFKELTYLLARESQVKQIVSDFHRFLTAERLATLRSRGVRRLEFTELFRTRGELLSGETLTLGPTEAEMLEAYDLVFGQ